MRELSERGLAVSDTGRTSSAHIYKILANRMLIGEKTVELDGEEYRLEGYYPAVISSAEFAELRHFAEQRFRRKGKGEIPGVVTGLGLTYCGYCGTAVTAQNIMGRRRDTEGRPQPGHRRLSCFAYRTGSGCPVSGSVSVAPIERALMHYCSDQINLSRLLEGDSNSAGLSAHLAQTRQRVINIEAQIQRVTDVLLSEVDAPPAAVLRRIRELEAQLQRDRNEISSLEDRLAAESSAMPAVAQAWAELVEGVEELNYDARMQARQLVADTFSRIVVYHHGFTPRANSNTIGLLLVGKRGVTRLIKIDRKTGKWKAAEEIRIRGMVANELPLPS
ncbi:recombinase zinc beta ribbon domain protein [Burkholderia pseudomallei MSHR7334]|nr:recombinase zinc beta ribbon domain protein [Burkholderia pseudomallei MSHR7334]